MDRSKRFGMAERIIAIGFWVNAVLMIVKLLAGCFGNSEAVFADGMESACDFVAILSTFIALKIGRKLLPGGSCQPLAVGHQLLAPWAPDKDRKLDSFLH